jgi:hypothetical protein
VQSVQSVLSVVKLRIMEYLVNCTKRKVKVIQLLTREAMHILAIFWIEKATNKCDSHKSTLRFALLYFAWLCFPIDLDGKSHSKMLYPESVVHHLDYRDKADERRAELEALNRKTLAKLRGESQSFLGVSVLEIAVVLTFFSPPHLTCSLPVANGRYAERNDQLS